FVDVLDGVVLDGPGVVRQHGGRRLGGGVLAVDGHLGVIGRAGVGGGDRVGVIAGVGPNLGDLLLAAGQQHELVGVAAGDGLDGVGDVPVSAGGTAVRGHTDNVGGGNADGGGDFIEQRHWFPLHQPCLHMTA